MGRIGPLEIALIVLVLVLLFGARRIPELMRAMGSGIRDFQKGARGEVDETEGEQEKQAKVDNPAGGKNG